MMKKIIAAALSILVGAFGYTIVDSAIEDRVATLESEVVELREEVSRYHPNYGLQTTSRRITTTQRLTTTNVFTTIKDIPTKTTNPRTTVALSFPASIGSFLEERADSIHKYLIQEEINGRFQYVPADRYTSVLLHSENNGTTYGSMIVSENYIYITENTAQLTDISEEVSYSYYYDKDYSQNSTALIENTTSINVKCKGYTDSTLAGKQIVFSVRWIGNSRPDSIISNTINSDGSFEYEAIYSTKNQLRNYEAKYSLSSISVS